MPSNLVKAGMVCFGIGLFPTIGIPFYTWKASRAIVPYQIQAWKDLGYEVTYAERHTHYFGFRTDLSLVRGTSDDGRNFEMQRMSIPLLPWMKARMSQANFFGGDDNASIRFEEAVGQFRRGRAENVDVQNLNISYRANREQISLHVSNTRIGSVNFSAGRIENVQMTRISLENTGLLRKTAEAGSIRQWDISAGLNGIKGVHFTEMELHMNPSRNSPLLARRGENSLRIASFEFDSEGDVNRLNNAYIAMTGVRFVQSSRGMNLQSRIRRTTEGRNWIVDINDESQTRTAIEVSWPVNASEANLFYEPSQISQVRGVLELTDPNGHIRDYVRQLASMNGIKRGQEDMFLPNFLASQGLLNQESASALTSWFRNPSRTLTVNFEEPIRGTVRLAARIKN
jgi:PAS domain-containing protein